METIVLPQYTSKLDIPISSIEYLEGIGNYTNVYIVGQKPIMVSRTLKRFEELLPNFIRIHKSRLVNPIYIVDYKADKRDDFYVVLPDDRKLTMSRRPALQLRLILARCQAKNRTFPVLAGRV